MFVARFISCNVRLIQLKIKFCVKNVLVSFPRIWQLYSDLEKMEGGLFSKEHKKEFEK
jgi:hypothetical protein